MTTTIDLINKIESIALSRIEILSDFDWDYLKACINAELKLVCELYSKADYTTLCDEISTINQTLTRASTSSDLTSIISSLAELKGIVKALPSNEENNNFIKTAYFDHAALDHFRSDTTIVIGDSHVNFFSGNEVLTYHSIGHDIELCPQSNNLSFTVLYLGPCLAYTCLSPTSKAQFANKINYLKKHFFHPKARIVLSLGEIDIRLHVLKQSELQSRNYTDIIEDILVNYSTLIYELISDGYNVYCWGPIASQKDSIPEDPSFPRYGNEQARNNATRYFNQRLSEICFLLGAGFLSIFEDMIDENGYTKAEYLSSDHFHLSQNALKLALPRLIANGLTHNT